MSVIWLSACAPPYSGQVSSWPSRAGELASATGARENILDLRAALSQMTDVAQEVLGEGADQGSLRDFYLALRLRVDYDPSTRIASATVTLDERWGSVSVSEGGLELLSPGDVKCLVRALNT